MMTYSTPEPMATCASGNVRRAATFNGEIRPGLIGIGEPSHQQFTDPYDHRSRQHHQPCLKRCIPQSLLHEKVD
jgi:hypothetical protein